MDIANELRRRILTGRYPAGQRIPPERELGLEFGCSRLTVAKAMAPLVVDGLIERYRGRGTFVVEQSKSHFASTGMKAKRTHVPVRGNVVKYISPGPERGARNTRDDVLGGLHGLLAEAGYHVSIDFYSNLEEHLSALAKIQDPQIAGLVLWPYPDPRTVEAVSTLIRNQVPLVMVDTYLPGVDGDFSVSDNIDGAAQMVHYLAGLGHRRITYLSLPINRTSLRDRLSGFLRGLVEADVPVTAQSVVQLKSLQPWSEVGGKPSELAEAIEGLMSDRKPPTAIFASHDQLGAEILPLLQRRGLKVPKDVSLAGYDGTDAGEFCDVPLSTIKQDFQTMAVVAARILMERFEGTSHLLRYNQLIRPTLIIRSSTQPPSK